MKKFIVIFLTFLFLITFKESAFGQTNGWQIDNLKSEIKVLKSGEVAVTETITVDFRTDSHHGIYRDLIYKRDSTDEKKRYISYKIESVTRNDQSENFTTSYTSNFYRVKIGRSSVTLVGKQVYKISYLAKGALGSFPDYDELYWNVTGNYWEIPIKSSSAVISLPKEGIIQISCYQGTYGSKETCTGNNDPLSANFVSTKSLNPSEGMTVAVGFTKDIVPILEGDEPKQITDDLFKLPSILAFLVTTLLGIILSIFLWLKKGRDFWFRSRFIDDPLSKTEIKPVGGYETIVVEYQPPDGMRPAEIGALMDQSADTLDVTATLVDLANRGYLDITEEEKKWIFGSKDYVLSKKEKNQDGLLNYEKELLDRLFDEAETVSLSSLKNKFYKDLAKVKDKLYSNMVEKKFFVENPKKVKIIYSGLATLVGVAGVILLTIGFISFFAPVLSIGGGLLISALFLLVVAQFMPQRTALGRKMYVRAHGYKLFIEKAEKYRQQFFERKNLFNEVLPYAIVFGATEKLAKAFKDMEIQPDQPNWYHGQGVFNAAVFGSSMNNFSNSFSSAIASSPSGSGGGGFSGGGGGGGGGGGW